MKILIVNTSERIGGAAVAANRLMKALHKSGIEVNTLLRDRQTMDNNVVSINSSYLKVYINKFRFLWERIVIFVSNKFNRSTLFRVSIANTGVNISNHPLVKEADVIHLHWINQGFLSLSDIDKLTKLGKPVVWTMHDMWPCTGICHYACGCNGFVDECGKCPFLGSDKTHDLSYKTLLRKRFLQDSGMHIVTVSSWLKRLAEESSIMKNLDISVIPNVLDATVFRPSDRLQARKALSISLKKKVILMGAARLDDPIKGFEYLLASLSVLKIRRKQDDLLLVLFGGIKGESSALEKLSIPFISLGLLTDVAMISLLYSAADVTVVPSHYETFGQTLIEAMACGCPAVSFDNSGQTDVIDHKVNGYLAKYRDVEDLATGIEWVLENRDKQALSDACVKKVQENYTEQVVAEKYITLYEQLLKHN